MANGRKITKEGQKCRKCECRVVKKTPKKKAFKPNQTYYYCFYLYCNSCKTMYMTEEGKVMIDKKPLSHSDLREQYKEETNGDVLSITNEYEDEYVFWLETNILALL